MAQLTTQQRQNCAYEVARRLSRSGSVLPPATKTQLVQFIGMADVQAESYETALHSQVQGMLPAGAAWLLANEAVARELIRTVFEYRKEL